MILLHQFMYAIQVLALQLIFKYKKIFKKIIFNKRVGNGLNINATK